MAGRQLPIVSLIIPAWLVVTMSGWRGLRGVWPAVLVSGGSFAIVQFLWSNYVGPELVDIVGGLVSLGSLGAVLRVVEAARSVGLPERRGAAERRRSSRGGRANAPASSPAMTAGRSSRAWMPWVVLSVFVTAWGIGSVKAFLNAGPAGAASYRATGRAPAPHPGAVADVRRARRSTRWCSATSRW